MKKTDRLRRALRDESFWTEKRSRIGFTTAELASYSSVDERFVAESLPGLGYRLLRSQRRWRKV